MFLFRIPFLIFSLPFVIAGGLFKLCSELLKIVLISLVFFAVAAESQNSSGQTSLNSELGKLASSVSNASLAEVTSYGANFLEEMQISFASSVKFVEAVMEEKLSPKVSPACLKTKKSQRSVDASEC